MYPLLLLCYIRNLFAEVLPNETTAIPLLHPPPPPPLPHCRSFIGIVTTMPCAVRRTDVAFQFRLVSSFMNASGSVFSRLFMNTNVLTFTHSDVQLPFVYPCQLFPESSHRCNVPPFPTPESSLISGAWVKRT